MSAGPRFAALMAGGRGTRFWPLSRRATPKQVLPLAGQPGAPSLLQETAARLAPLVPPERLLVLTGRDMEAAVRGQLPEVPPDNFLVEPQGRGTAPCLGWAAVEALRRGGPDASLIALPADHAVADPEGLRAALSVALQAAEATGALLTLGLRPTRPETGFGYIELGEPLPEAPGVCQVRRFVEKPDRETARGYLAAGGFLWNAGVFAARADRLLAAIALHLPRSGAALARLAAGEAALPQIWPELDAISLDHGVLERHGHTAVVPCEFGWSDLGTWPEAAARWPEVPGGRGVAGAVLAVESTDNAVYAPGQAVALVGVRDLVVVQTPDALLVLHRDAAQAVGRVLDQLEAAALYRLL